MRRRQRNVTEARPGRGAKPFGRLAQELATVAAAGARCHRSGLRLQRVFWPESHLLLRPESQSGDEKGAAAGLTTADGLSGRPAGHGLWRGPLSLPPGPHYDVRCVGWFKTDSGGTGPQRKERLELGEIVQGFDSLTVCTASTRPVRGTAVGGV